MNAFEEYVAKYMQEHPEEAIAMQAMMQKMYENMMRETLEKMKENCDQMLQMMGNQEYKQSPVQAPQSKNTPHKLTREEFLGLVDDTDPTPYDGNYRARAEESELHKLGYSVSQNVGMSDRQRQDLLEILIRTDKITKRQVLNHLHYLIEINGKKNANSIALSKWKRDYEFVLNLEELPF